MTSVSSHKVRRRPFITGDRGALALEPELPTAATPRRSRLDEFTGAVIAFCKWYFVPAREAAGEFGATPNAELAVDPAEMELDRIDAQIELRTNVLATQTISSEERNAEFGRVSESFAHAVAIAASSRWPLALPGAFRPRHGAVVVESGKGLRQLGASGAPLTLPTQPFAVEQVRAGGDEGVGVPFMNLDGCLEAARVPQHRRQPAPGSAAPGPGRGCRSSPASCV